MVTAILLGPGLARQKMRWPTFAGVDQMQRRLCRAFRRNWRKERAVVHCQGRALSEFEKPWIFMPRRTVVDGDVTFEQLADAEAEVLKWARGDDGDDSDGFSTPSDIEAAMDTGSSW
jgi:hypothetical protein